MQRTSQKSHFSEPAIIKKMEITKEYMESIHGYHAKKLLHSLRKLQPTSMQRICVHERSRLNALRLRFL